MHMAHPEHRSLVSRKAVLLSVAGLFLLTPAAWAEPCGGSAQGFLQKLTDLHRGEQDIKTRLLIDEVSGAGARAQHVVREVMVYSRPKESKLVMLTVAPKTEVGNGYLRIDHNLWFYDVRLGHWERRTERDSISGTNVRRSDIDLSDFSDLYSAKSCREERVKGALLSVLELEAKPGTDVPFVKQKIWVNPDLLVVRSEDYAATGKLLRTMVVTRSAEILREDLGRKVAVASRMSLFDEVDKTRKTVLQIQGVSQGPLESNFFTKAFVESKSR